MQSAQSPASAAHPSGLSARATSRRRPNPFGPSISRATAAARSRFGRVLRLFCRALPRPLLKEEDSSSLRRPPGTDGRLRRSRRGSPEQRSVRPARPCSPNRSRRPRRSRRRHRRRRTYAATQGGGAGALSANARDLLRAARDLLCRLSGEAAGAHVGAAAMSLFSGREE